MNNEQKIIQLLEEIRDQQKQNVEKALAMQKVATKKIFWLLIVLVLVIVILVKII